MSQHADYQITHTTTYSYANAVAICQNQLRMTPRRFQQYLLDVNCHESKCLISPEPDVVNEHEDYFGNRVISFGIESLHRFLEVSMISHVSVTARDLVADTPWPTWDSIVPNLKADKSSNWHRIQPNVADSNRIRKSEDFENYARESFTEGRNVMDATRELTRRIHDDFRYDTAATDVSTTTEDAFSQRAGVCQDFAHVQIAALRSVGVPARYVSGYLRTKPPAGQPRLVGADESHAWVSVYMGGRYGWVDFDPTNACLACVDHIPICVGRDFDEVSPMRGVVLGGGATSLNVSVDVAPIDGTQ